MRRVFLCFALLLISLCSMSAKKDYLRTMSLNIRVQFPADTGDLSWNSRKVPCLKAIQHYSPDLLGLQEATVAHRQFLLAELKNYQMVDRSRKPGTVDVSIKYNDNPIFFRSDKFELLDYGYFWLNEDQTPNKRGWDANSVRNATWVKLKNKKSGQVVFYFNTHFDHMGSVARYNSSLLVDSKIKEIAGDDAVVFLTADFNVPSGTKDIQPLNDYLEEANLTVKNADKAATFNNFGKEKMWLDHIFYRNATATSFEVVDEEKYGVKYISDHYPVYSDFTITIKK